MRLLPRDEQFFELFTQIAQRGVDAARQLGELLGSDGDRRAYLIESISRLELEADQLTHDVTVRLDRSFITPLDREDIHFLASSLDNVIDRIDGIARRTKIFRIGTSPRGAVLLAEVIHRAALQLLAAVRNLVARSRTRSSPPAAKCAGSRKRATPCTTSGSASCSSMPATRSR